MSKASEYARRHKDNTRPKFNRDATGSTLAEVQTDGTLHICMAIILDQAEAAEFAYWIIDTFGETE